MLFDNAFGWTVFLLPKEALSYHFFTAHLGVDYRSPAFVEDSFEMTARIGT